MKNKIMIGYMSIATIAIIVLMILLFNLSGENRDLKLSLDSITPEITEVIITPEPTKEPVINPTATPSPTQTPVPTRTPYEPDEDDIAFMNMVIEEGRTITLKISEWDMINIMCDKMGFDEYHYRFREINEEGVYYLVRSREVAPAANYVWFGIDQNTGNIVDDGVETVEPRYIGNIFYMEVVAEPVRLPKGDELIELFIEKIFGELPEGTYLEFEIAGCGDWEMYYWKTDDSGNATEIIEIYFIDDYSGDVYDAMYVYVGSLVD